MKNSKSKFKSAFDAMEKTSVGEKIIDNVEGIASDIEGDLDFEDAYKWYKVAADNGSEEAQEQLKRFTKKINGKIKVKKK